MERRFSPYLLQSPGCCTRSTFTTFAGLSKPASNNSTTSFHSSESIPTGTISKWDPVSSSLSSSSFSLSSAIHSPGVQVEGNSVISASTSCTYSRAILVALAMPPVLIALTRIPPSQLIASAAIPSSLKRSFSSSASSSCERRLSILTISDVVRSAKILRTRASTIPRPSLEPKMRMPGTYTASTSCSSALQCDACRSSNTAAYSSATFSMGVKNTMRWRKPGDACCCFQSTIAWQRVHASTLEGQFKLLVLPASASIAREAPAPSPALPTASSNTECTSFSKSD
mmetsp:Transcript_8228/g.21859  ORF Transcript_8228/g.21859 Transcript_8228/m.21859 type:complete len:285 (-) Transcript_8228:1707-2561(-)